MFSIYKLEMRITKKDANYALTPKMLIRGYCEYELTPLVILFQKISPASRINSFFLFVEK